MFRFNSKIEGQSGPLVTLVIGSLLFLLAMMVCTSCGDSRAYSGSGQRLIAQEDSINQAKALESMHLVSEHYKDLSESEVAVDNEGNTQPLFPVKVINSYGVTRLAWLTRTERAMFKAGDIIYCQLDDWDGKWITSPRDCKACARMVVQATPDSE